MGSSNRAAAAGFCLSWLVFAPATALAQATPPAAAQPAAAGDASPAATSPADQPICTDRPTKANGPCTVPAGAWQVEADLVNWSHTSSGGVRTDFTLAPNPTLKRGLTDTLDIEVSLAPYESLRVRSPVGETRASGIGDLYGRVKWAAYPGSTVSFSLIPWIKAPTAARSLGNARVEEGVSVPININLPDKFALTLGPEIDGLENAALNGQHLNIINLVGLSRPVSEKLTLFVEAWNDQNFDPMGDVVQSSADVAAAYLITKTLQLDGGANFGLTRATPGVQLYLGVSKRF